MSPMRRLFFFFSLSLSLSLSSSLTRSRPVKNNLFITWTHKKNSLWNYGSTLEAIQASGKSHQRRAVQMFCSKWYSISWQVCQNMIRSEITNVRTVPLLSALRPLPLHLFTVSEIMISVRPPSYCRLKSRANAAPIQLSRKFFRRISLCGSIDSMLWFIQTCTASKPHTLLSCRPTANDSLWLLFHELSYFHLCLVLCNK